MDAFLRDLLAHSEWANAVFFSAWAKSPARDHDELRTRVAHIVGVQEGFLSLLRGEQPGGPPGEPPLTFADLKARGESSHAGLRDLAATLDSETLSRTVHVPWFPDPNFLYHYCRSIGASRDAHAAPSRPMPNASQGLRRRAEERRLDHLVVEAEAPGQMELTGAL